ncbi:acyl-CoA synthetase [Salmonella enterica subsp. enterica]|uniref:Acyl-CoA synthetase n=1 Tax=Salmonella enterica I TaxID=59201 RepID=A0A379WND3_SALET|nr:acyl-CoA synthetase [Salmonella enterica subsp. enterica]
MGCGIQRAGLLRVQDTHELFSAVETLSHMRPLRGDRLMIISNGAAPAALALDELWSRNGKLATLSEETCLQLQQALPRTLILPIRWICVMTPAANITSKRWISCSPVRILTRLWLSTLPALPRRVRKAPML